MASISGKLAAVMALSVGEVAPPTLAEVNEACEQKCVPTFNGTRLASAPNARTPNPAVRIANGYGLLFHLYADGTMLVTATKLDDECITYAARIESAHVTFETLVHAFDKGATCRGVLVEAEGHRWMILGGAATTGGGLADMRLRYQLGIMDSASALAAALRFKAVRKAARKASRAAWQAAFDACTPTDSSERAAAIGRGLARRMQALDADRGEGEDTQASSPPEERSTSGGPLPSAEGRQE